MKVNYGPVETEISLTNSRMIRIAQRVGGDESDRAYSSVEFPLANAEAIALEILRLISIERTRPRA
jgi:hypothetical protein